MWQKAISAVNGGSGFEFDLDNMEYKQGTSSLTVESGKRYLIVAHVIYHGGTGEASISGVDSTKTTVKGGYYISGSGGDSSRCYIYDVTANSTTITISYTGTVNNKNTYIMPLE